MKKVWLRANSATWVISHLSLFVLPLFELVERDVFRAHGTHAGYEEGCREALTVNFAVELFGRLVDPQPLKHPRKLFVADVASHHLFLYQPLRFFFPLPVRRELQPATLVRQFFHSLISALPQGQIFRSSQFSHDYFRSYTTEFKAVVLHVLSKPFFARTTC